MKKLIILTMCITMLGLCGCSDSTSTSTKDLKMPQTSTNTRRQSYNDSLTKDAEKETSDFTYISVDIRPKFILHIDSEGNITEFEALNDEAISLSGQTTEEWQNKPYKDAFTDIIEQCIIDGYISDNNPVIKVDVTGDNADSVTRDVSDVLEYSTSIHGLTVEIHLNDVE